MAEVLAPIVSQTGTITMLHPPSDAFTNPASSQTHQSTRSSGMSRSHVYSAQGSGMGYRGTSSAPIAPYAFQTTPQLRQEHRTNSAPGNPYAASSLQTGSNQLRSWHPSNPSSSSDSTASTASSSRSKDDSMIQTTPSSKLLDTLDKRPSTAISFSSALPDLSLALDNTPVKPSPDRYRRGPRRTDSSNGATPAPASTQQQQTQTPPANKSAVPSGSGMAAVAHLYPGPSVIPAARQAHLRTSSADDMQLPRQSASELAKRYRRRSVGGFEADTPGNPTASFTPAAPVAKAVDAKETKASQNTSASSSFHERNASGESIASSRPSSKHSSRPSSARQESARPTTPSRTQSPSPTSQNRPINIPPRNSSDATKRLANPSPLSNPVTEFEAESPQRARASGPSPATQQLTAIANQDQKGMKSRLRRAFSFGSASELRRATAENNMSKRKEKTPEEIEAEHEAIAAKQEAAGIGAGIYSGQGFTGSTDNVSISSTASSASIMLRKMGRGVKKGTRSLKGLFRPKSVVGVPAADAVLTPPSLAEVSLVTVEAERDKVNVNLNPHDQPGGGTGFPKLERNSLDAAMASRDPGSSSGKEQGGDPWSRKSIVGGDRERAEVLAAVRKGILKRTGTNSDSGSPVIRSADHTDTPNSSAPSTPADEHAQPLPGQLGGSDYFNGLPRLPNSSTRSLPTTSTHGAARSISFSPRIQFHDAWSSTEYDRRGDIATCNRLTPMLAQQIKEELNSFKMEMEVHELSKPHTHFF